ncbi:MAG TPA: DinB family protein [Longimicrobium sp.]|nr:DinB family protein [Longimicrobium sp.]
MSDDRTAREPRTRDDIVRELERVRIESRAYWMSFAPDGFLAALGEAWSPADNVRHLTKSVRPVAMALRIPRLMLRLRFGRARAPSRTYGALVEVYRGKLAAGGQAGSYAPSPLRAEGDPEAARARILAQHDEAVAALIQACARWSEDALDRYQLPHPLLGNLTIREMLFFTVYHNQHHVNVVRHRVAEAKAAPAR